MSSYLRQRHKAPPQRVIRWLFIAGASVIGLFSYSPTARADACAGSGYQQAAPGTSATGHFGPELNNAALPNGFYCVDFTIHKSTGSNPDVGYIEFALIVEKTSNVTPNPSDPGNIKVISVQPVVYSLVTGVPIPPGGTETLYAPPRTVTSSTVGPGLTMDGDDAMIKGELVPGGNGLSFTFTGTTGATVIVDGFTTSNNPRVTVSSGPNPCASNCNLTGTYSTSVNYLNSNNDGTLSSPISGFDSGIGAVPEINGGKLPPLVALLSMIYLLVSRRKSHGLERRLR